MNSFSVLMSVYRNDKPEDFRVAVESVTVRQTLKPDEVVMVVDGPVSDAMREIIISLQREIPYIRPVWLEKNGGLGNALHIGMEQVSHELVARMDADDIAMPDRFEKQVAFMETNPDIAVCGGQISEFIDSPDNIVAYRRVPLSAGDCRKYYRDRDPVNHMTALLRRDAILSVGNYLPWHLDEDTYLWGRVLKAGFGIANLPDILVNVRVGREMYARRGGWQYFRSDAGILKWKLDNGLTSRRRYVYNYLVRFVVQVLMPNKVRAWVFKNLLRS